MKRTGYIAAIVAVSVASAAFAHNGATGIVKDRMVAMSAMGDALKATAPMMSGETNYDAGVVRDTAAVIKSHAGAAMTDLFPADNANKASFVKDAIWDDWETFAALAKQLETYAEGLALAADNGFADQLEGMGDAGTMMGADTMMGAGAMMGGDAALTPATLTVEDLAAMPVDTVFAKLGDTCASCHTQFRSKAE